MTCRLWLAAGLLGCLCAPAWADPLLSIGPDIPMFITASGSVRYDDNIFLVPTDRTSDEVFSITPGIDIHKIGDRNSFDLALMENFVRYASHSILNDNLGSVNGTYGYTGSELTLNLAANAAEIDESSLGAVTAEQTLKHDTGGASVNTELALTGKFKFGSGFDFNRTTYPTGGLISNDTFSVPLNLFYSITPKVDLSAGYTRERTLQTDDINDSWQDFYNVGARGEFTPKLSGSVQVGVTDLRVDNGSGGNTDNLGLSAALNYAFTPKTSLSLSANSGFTTSPQGADQKVESIQTSGTFALSPAWAATAGIIYSHTEYLTTPGRDENFWSGSLGVSYILTQTTNFDFQYYFRRNDSTLASAEFDDNLLSLTASTRF